MADAKASFTEEETIRLMTIGVGLGFGCSAAIAQTLGEGMQMTELQVGKMLDVLSTNGTAMRAIAMTAFENSLDGEPNSEKFKAIVAATAEMGRQALALEKAEE